MLPSCLLSPEGLPPPQCLRLLPSQFLPPKAGARKPQCRVRGWGPRPSPGADAGQDVGRRRRPISGLPSEGRPGGFDQPCQPSPGLLPLRGTAYTLQAAALPASCGLWRTEAGGTLHPPGKPAPVPHRIMAGGVDDVHRGHVLVQEVAPDCDGVAAAAVVFLDGHSRGKPGPCGTQAAPGRVAEGSEPGTPTEQRSPPSSLELVLAAVPPLQGLPCKAPPARAGPSPHLTWPLGSTRPSGTRPPP